MQIQIRKNGNYVPVDVDQDMVNEAINKVSGTFLDKNLSGQYNQRATRLLAFALQNDYSLDEILIVQNNNWSKPPQASKWKAWSYLGGTNYKYQVWAVVPKD